MESLLDKIYTIRVERFTRHDYTTSNTMIHDVLHHSAVEGVDEWSRTAAHNTIPGQFF